jgi:hypothetical protein
MLGWFGKSWEPSPSADDSVLESLEAGRAGEVVVAGQSLGTPVEYGRESEKSSSTVSSGVLEEEEDEEEEEEKEEEEVERGSHVADMTARYDTGAGVLAILPSPAASETGSRQSIVSVNAPQLPPRRVSLDSQPSRHSCAASQASQGSRGSEQISSIEDGGSRHTS